jgi:hypothetical protein
MLFHFTNNAVSALFISSAGLPANASLPFEALSELNLADAAAVLPAAGFFWALGSPLLIYAGSILLEPSRPLGPNKYRDKRPLLIAALIATGVIFAGFSISVSRLAQDESFRELIDGIASQLESVY